VLVHVVLLHMRMILNDGQLVKISLNLITRFFSLQTCSRAINLRKK